MTKFRTVRLTWPSTSKKLLTPDPSPVKSRVAGPLEVWTNWQRGFTADKSNPLRAFTSKLLPVSDQTAECRSGSHMPPVASRA